MEKFTEKFIEEATDNISNLEDALLKLENDPGSTDLVERVFRSMHSLKGGGSMFGFTKLSDFTHHLENLWDNIREGHLQVNQGLLDITLQAVDHLKVLLKEKGELSPDTKTTHNNLTVQVMKFLGEENTADAGEGDSDSSSGDSGDDSKTYYIYFDPAENIFDDGTNPLFLLDELNSLGQCKIIPYLHRIPVLHEMEPVKCYTYWEVILATQEDENAIHDVFIFVQEQAEINLHLLSHTNLFKNSSFLEKLEQQAGGEKDLGFEGFRDMVESLAAKEDSAEVADNRPAKGSGSKESTISSIRVESEKIDHMMNLVSELVTTQARLSLRAEQLKDSELEGIAENVQKLTRQLRDNAFDVALVPVETMLTRFQRLVRDLSGSLNKKVNFTAEGTDTELDKNIIEKLTDPLLHIIRNCIDHGIETPEERSKAGKPEEGKITFKAFYSGASVHIQVHDDGKGIDPEKIRKKAVERNLISPEASLSRKEIFDLTFHPGFSTAENITDVSGRGVGMDVVKRNLGEIRGEVEVDSEPGTGTTITVKLPLTLSIVDGLLVQIAESKYVIPLSAVDKIYAVKHSEVVDHFNNLIVLDGERTPFFNLREEFHLPESENETEEIVAARYEETRVGLVVDNVIGEYQAVLKSMGKMYKEQEMISGATILGDGTVALVMDTNKMIEKFSSYQEDRNSIVE
ncbi:MAG: chemotaxis protein CheA [Bacteroidales bacterium]